MDYETILEDEKLLEFQASYQELKDKAGQSPRPLGRSLESKDNELG